MSDRPVLRHILNLWSQRDYPSRQKPWGVEGKLKALAQAGFDGFSELPTAEHRLWADKLGLILVGYFAASDDAAITRLMEQNARMGAVHINVQLGDHDTPLREALRLTKFVFKEAKRLGVKPAIEVHRDTCTETPEKTESLANAYQKATRLLLPMTWDFSHLAVVKHLAPPYWDRLGTRPDLIQHARQFHFRPFNGHHCQVPVTDASGRLTPEMKDYLPFVQKVMETWLATAAPGREMFAVPEMGPTSSGYNLSTMKNSWEEAVILRRELERCWRRALKSWKAPAPKGISP